MTGDGEHSVRDQEYPKSVMHGFQAKQLDLFC